MTDDFTEIDGVGPAREEKLNDAGYETYDELAEADYEELADEIQRFPEDSALEVVVQAQNLADLQEAEVEADDDGDDESEELTDEEVEEELNELEDVVEEVEEEDENEDGEELYEVSIDLEVGDEYDTLYHTIIEQRCTLERTNRKGVETYGTLLSELRTTADGEEVVFTLTADELNNLHNAVLEQRMDYQGDNLIDYMDALRRVENKINNSREKYLF